MHLFSRTLSGRLRPWFPLSQDLKKKNNDHTKVEEVFWKSIKSGVARDKKQAGCVFELDRRNDLGLCQGWLSLSSDRILVFRVRCRKGLRTPRIWYVYGYYCGVIWVIWHILLCVPPWQTTTSNKIVVCREFVNLFFPKSTFVCHCLFSDSQPQFPAEFFRSVGKSESEKTQHNSKTAVTPQPGITKHTTCCIAANNK